MQTQVEEDWTRYSEAIRTNMLTGDITNFTNWRVIQYTMFTLLEKGGLSCIQALPDWENKWKEAIIESPVGSPMPYEEYPETSSNMIFQAMTLSYFLSATGCKLEELDTIFEFGAGYGCMCRLIHRLGFSGSYINFDMPCLLQLQEYYLSRTVEGRISFLSDADEFTEQLAGNQGKSLFMACWSISEAPIPLRIKVLQAVRDNTDYIFICFQAQHRDFDNMAFFKKEVAAVFTSHRWRLDEMPGLAKSGTRNYFLLGARI